MSDDDGFFSPLDMHAADAQHDSFLISAMQIAAGFVLGIAIIATVALAVLWK